MIQILTDLFNTCLHHQQVPKAWKNALVVLIHKKGNTSDIKNYRPISLPPIPIMYKVFSNILLQRMIRTLDSTNHWSKRDLERVINFHDRPSIGNK